MEKQSGFTLIELVVVIVILGILAATALPKFIDLQSDARLAATQGVAGAVSSAFAVNSAAYAVAPAKAVRVSGSADVNAIAGSILAAGMPTGYTATAAAAATVLCSTSVGIGLPILISATIVGTTTTASATLICTG